jgi:hypothetical protein
MTRYVTVQATVRTLCDLSKFVAKNIILCLHKSVRTVNCYLVIILGKGYFVTVIASVSQRLPWRPPWRRRRHAVPQAREAIL